MATQQNANENEVFAQNRRNSDTPRAPSAEKVTLAQDTDIDGTAVGNKEDDTHRTDAIAVNQGDTKEEEEEADNGVHEISIQVSVMDDRDMDNHGVTPYDDDARDDEENKDESEEPIATEHDNSNQHIHAAAAEVTANNPNDESDTEEQDVEEEEVANQHENNETSQHSETATATAQTHEAAEVAQPLHPNAANEAKPEREQSAQNEEEEEEEKAQYASSAEHDSPLGHNAHSAATAMKTELHSPSINYWWIALVSLLSGSFGVFMFIFTNIWWIILFFFFCGLAPSFIMEYYRYSKQAKSQKTENSNEESDDDQPPQKYSRQKPRPIDADNEIDEDLVEWKEDKEEHEIYVQTDFDNSYSETVEESGGDDGSKKKKRKRNVNITGSTRVYHPKDSGVLIVEKRALYVFEDYKGYEIGGGLSSLTGFSITIIVQIIKMIINLKSDTKTDWAMNIFVLLIITLSLLCLGCIVEIELRKTNVLAPNKKLFTTATVIALHEIISLDRHSTTNYQNEGSNLNEYGEAASLTVKKIAIKWFQCLLGVYKLLQWMFIALYINTAFVMLVLVFIIFGLMFDLNVNKSEGLVKNESLIVCVFLWMAVAIGIYGIFYTSQGIFDCDNKVYNRLNTQDRIEKSHQKCIWILLAIATLCMFLAAAMVSAIDADIYGREVEATEANTASMKIYNCWYCISSDKIVVATESNDAATGSDLLNGNATDLVPVNGTRRRMQENVETVGYYENEPYCQEGREYMLTFSLYFVWTAWYLCLIAAYYWHLWDQAIFKFDRKNNERVKRVWKQYSVIRIGLKTSQSVSYFKIFSSTQSNTVINIELNPSQAQQLQSYLRKIVPWFRADAASPAGYLSDGKSKNNMLVVPQSSGSDTMMMRFFVCSSLFGGILALVFLIFVLSSFL